MCGRGQFKSRGGIKVSERARLLPATEGMVLNGRGWEMPETVA